MALLSTASYLFTVSQTSPRDSQLRANVSALGPTALPYMGFQLLHRALRKIKSRRTGMFLTLSIIQLYKVSAYLLCLAACITGQVLSILK